MTEIGTIHDNIIWRITLLYKMIFYSVENIISKAVRTPSHTPTHAVTRPLTVDTVLLHVRMFFTKSYSYIVEIKML